MATEPFPDGVESVTVLCYARAADITKSRRKGPSVQPVPNPSGKASARNARSESSSPNGQQKGLSPHLHLPTRRSLERTGLNTGWTSTMTGEASLSAWSVTRGSMLYAGIPRAVNSLECTILPGAEGFLLCLSGSTQILSGLLGNESGLIRHVATNCSRRRLGVALRMDLGRVSCSSS